MKFDYRTPESANDTITFVGITDGIEPNSSGVNLYVGNLKVAPVIQTFIEWIIDETICLDIILS